LYVYLNNMKDQSFKPGDKIRLQQNSEEKEITENPFIKEFIYALPYVTAILNEDKKVICSNNISLDTDKEMTVEEFFGFNIGARLKCIHANNEGETCNPEGICKYCGVPNAILRSGQTGKKESQETSLSIKTNGSTKTFDIRITAAPFHHMNKRFTLVTIIDISETKRKRALERIFFHDVLNKTASLTGAFELLNDKSNENTEEKNELIQLSDEIINDLNEEILLQKNLMDAESGDLETKISSFSTREIIEESVKQIMQYPETENKNVVIHENTADEEIYSDPILLKRIIINMLKNAVEALKNKETVKIGCNSEQNKVKIWVYNPGFIPKDVQIQIFERTFSTKDRNRGLGTYSMKLLGEQYLGGKVDFVSTKEEGTTFFIRLPKG